MHTLESLKRKLETAGDLHSVITTMKALAAANIRHCEQAVLSLSHYARTVELGLQVVLRQGPKASPRAREAPREVPGFVVFGSDQGMCGPLNSQVADHALEAIVPAPATRRTLAVGQRVASRLEEALGSVEVSAPPSSIAGSTSAVQDLLGSIDRWQTEEGLDQVTLFYPEHQSRASFVPTRVSLLPIDQRWLQQLQARPWPTRQLPLFTMEANLLFSRLIRQYLFVGLYRAFAETLASENASRLLAMQGAERNIEERLVELRNSFHQQRQQSITEELLDIVGGFEAMQTSE
jgi:F-type H+-transporting ATPase subunit gamma